MKIHFEDRGQDFLTWQINNNGVIVDCLPFQSSFWVGGEVRRQARLKVGGKVTYSHDGFQTSITLKYRIRAIEPDLTAEEFSERYPVGSPCRYYPVAGDSTHKITKIRTPAWVLGHGATVVSVEGVRGGVDINHLVMEG